MGDLRVVKDMVCVSCPLGCNISVEYEGTEVFSVKGNSCKRGESYAQTEISNPTRMLTTTVRVNGGRLPVVPVKSANPIPKSKMFDCMKIINGVTANAPVKMGDVIVENILGLGIDIIATNEN